MFVMEQGAQAVLTKNIGPNALDTFWIAGVPVYALNGGTVREAAEAYKAEQLQVMFEASVEVGDGNKSGQATQ
jgi:predicted Fe-Mo cluster-binding NifX family protein